MKSFVTILFCFVATSLHAQLAPLKTGMKITASFKALPGNYALESTDLTTPVIEISGDNIVVDFNNAMLRGNNGRLMPDEFEGLAILIKNGRNITIKNLNARGYKVALMALNVEGLHIENCNLSYNYRKRLNSTQEKEDLSDWMSYHQNEKDEWLRYGAAMYLRNCRNFRVRNNIVTGGQCALMLTLCEEGTVENNNFSFNSAIGIGMYRSSRNKIINNKLDFNVRGHSEGVYNRGQDSAAILVFEQCNANVFANNSATHSGDGFFLWAGQTTMDTGKGGCNDNVLFRNDFSYAPTNGIEVTFSRNTIIENTLVECDHGIWGGYSYNTSIRNNKFALNRIAIAIEHGQEDTVRDNYFTGNGQSLRLWARSTQPPDWGYAKNRDTRSRDYVIAGNRFVGDSLVYNISNTHRVKLENNLEEQAKKLYQLDSLTLAMLDSSKQLAAWERSVEKAREFPPFRRGRGEIRMTEWGPYDFRYPLVWRTNPVDTSGLLKFEVLGPRGSWRVVRSSGVTGISRQSGSFPAVITASRQQGSKDGILIEMEYTGERVVSQFGEVVAAGRPYRFAFRDARVPLRWDVQWFAWDSLSPVENAANWQRAAQGQPVLDARQVALDFAWWGGLTVKGGKVPKFVTVAESRVEVPAGEYELSVTWDDAVRVYIDGRLIVNEWNPALYKFDESPNRRVKVRLGGRHVLKVEHVELGGFATLGVKLSKV